MSPHNHKRITSSLAQAIIYVAKNWQLKDRRFPIDCNFTLLTEEISSRYAKKRNCKNSTVIGISGNILEILEMLTNYIQIQFASIVHKFGARKCF